MSSLLDERVHIGGDESAAGDVLPVGERVGGHLAGLDRMIWLTSIADAKAAPIVAVNATIAAISVTQAHNLQDFMRDGNVAHVASVWVLAIVYVVLASLSVVQAIRVFLPSDSPGRRSVLYFADIARMPLHEFVARSTTLSAAQLELDALQQQHAVAVVVANKLSRVRTAFAAMLGAIIAWLGLVILANV